jgi:hypothetical protein
MPAQALHATAFPNNCITVEAGSYFKRLVDRGRRSALKTTQRLPDFPKALPLPPLYEIDDRAVVGLVAERVVDVMPIGIQPDRDLIVGLPHNELSLRAFVAIELIPVFSRVIVEPNPLEALKFFVHAET